MNDPVHIAALACLDATELITTCGRHIAMQDPLRWKGAFDTAFPTFRRLDVLSRAVCLVVEALDLDVNLTGAERDDTALLLDTCYGCLDADLRFEHSLHTPFGIQPAVFPYTLPSTCLGEVAIRHGLKGCASTYCTPTGDRVVALDQARYLIATGEARAAVVCIGDWLPEASSRPLDLDPTTGVVAILLRTGHPNSVAASLYDELACDPLRRIFAHLNAP